MKKFANAVIYGHDDANEILVENGVIKAIGKDLGPAVVSPKKIQLKPLGIELWTIRV